MREPRWWYEREPGWQASLLRPAATIYGAIASRRLENPAIYRSELPVICVGNFTAGGTGKTPFAIALAKLLTGTARTPWFLTRGYGGSEFGPLLVDTTRHTTKDVGDEPLLLARHGQTVVARDRAAGTRFINEMAEGDAVIIMDDGLQNPAVAKDLAIALVDRNRAFGNMRVIPAGPLRASLKAQAQVVNLIVTTGTSDDLGASLEQTLSNLNKPVTHATTSPAGDTAWLHGHDVIAFAGIANPDRFYDLIRTLGGNLIATRTFPDHHEYRDSDATNLIATAEAANALLVATEKDIVRLSGRAGAHGKLARRARPLPIITTFSAGAERVILEHVQNAIQRARSRPLSSR